MFHLWSPAPWVVFSSTHPRLHSEQGNIISTVKWLKGIGIYRFVLSSVKTSLEWFLKKRMLIILHYLSARHRLWHLCWPGRWTLEEDGANQNKSSPFKTGVWSPLVWPHTPARTDINSNYSWILFLLSKNSVWRPKVFLCRINNGT